MASDCFIGDVICYAFDFAPRGWATCSGQLLPINQNQALFSILGTTYGGNGVTTFALPDLRGRSPIHWGNGPGLSPYSQGQVSGTETVTLISTQLPAHTHTMQGDAATDATANFNVAAAGRSLGKSTGLTGTSTAFAENVYDTGTPGVAMAAGTVGAAGGSQPHENRQPYLVMNWCIALQGIFPSRN